MFNQGDFWDKAKSGELDVVLQVDKPGPDHQPPGTRGQILEYRDSDAHTIAIVHQYLRTDGTLGGVGKPDPIALVKNSRQ